MSLHWYACAEPERPPDPYVRWHYRSFITRSVCAGCALKVQVVARQYPDDSHVAWLYHRITGEHLAVGG